MLKDSVPQDADRPTSNPLPPQSEAFADYLSAPSAQQVLECVAKEVPNFGTEQVQHSSLLNDKYSYLHVNFIPMRIATIHYLLWIHYLFFSLFLGVGIGLVSYHHSNLMVVIFIDKSSLSFPLKDWSMSIWSALQ